jgi:transcriptional regulator with XRE-family HTH domain
MTGDYVRAVLSGNIRKLRNRREWPQAELAKRANISRNFLSEIERGRKWPYPETLQNLAEAFGVEVFEFFKPEESGPVPEIEAYISRLSNQMALAVEESVRDTVFSIARQYSQTPLT